MNVSNDIVVTTRGLDNLLACMDDARIGMAVPVCNASCNDQQMTLPYSSMDELQRAAAAHNVSNPDLWEERLKLLYQTMGIFHALGAQFDGQRNWYYLCFSKPG